MFTGIVQAVGRVLETHPRSGDAGGVRLVVEPRWDVAPSALEPGESVAVSGVCLTLAQEPHHRERGLLAFDIIRETLARTSLGSLAPGRSVNLERSLRPTDLMGGHVVQGHVDAMGTVERVAPGDDWRLWIRPDPPAPPSDDDLMQYVVPKGSIAIEGVSLTVAGVDHDPAGRPAIFHVALIPTTLERTTLAHLRPGDRVNLESDVMARTVVHWLRHFHHRNTAP
ncbi:riboflavin synthase [Leptolyngbya sp. 15MV]|nr:riboflavin synthase [Leptolyngbya sp. 15MV]